MISPISAEYVARGDREEIGRRFSRIFFSHSLIQNALVISDDALVNVIKQSWILKFAKSKNVSQDYSLKLV